MSNKTYHISHNGNSLNGIIPLAGSKSISNRALIIRALSGSDFQINGLASSKDTQVLNMLLKESADKYDVGPAGTSFRFLTAFLSLQPGTQILTGSERMLKRPIGQLVEALKKIGADIEYLGESGYPPLLIKTWGNKAVNHLSIPANISSQFISALLMIAPKLDNGLVLTLEGKIVSRPYIEMTLGLMEQFGVSHSWDGQVITIEPEEYKPKDFQVEADWSAASYYYSMAAMDASAQIDLLGLSLETWQGDAALIPIYEKLGVQTTEIEGGIRLTGGKEKAPMLEWNFLRCPDLAQTIFASCGALSIQGLFSGLETLKIKETDRITAMQKELGKVQVWLIQMPAKFSKKSEETFYMIDGKASIDNPTFETYDDHRMAMALTPLAYLGNINIEDPLVVEKSYPEFWDHIQLLGFEVVEK